MLGNNDDTLKGQPYDAATVLLWNRRAGALATPSPAQSALILVF